MVEEDKKIEEKKESTGEKTVDALKDEISVDEKAGDVKVSKTKKGKGILDQTIRDFHNRHKSKV